MLASEISRPSTGGGMALVIRSPTEYGKPSTRAESLTAALALIVPKVTIWATRSAPYLRVTYRMTSPRPRSSKSMSMSGIDTRSGFRNRSKTSPCSTGSSPVMPSAYATSEPAAEPRPGPTRTPCSRAHRTRSATTRK